MIEEIIAGVVELVIEVEKAGESCLQALEKDLPVLRVGLCLGGKGVLEEGQQPLVRAVGFASQGRGHFTHTAPLSDSHPDILVRVQ
jgi:hypothetical protein